VSDRAANHPGETPDAQNAADEAVLAQSRQHTRRSFAVAAVAAAAGYGAYRWIAGSPEIGRQERPLREAFEADADVSRALFGERGLSPTYPVSRSSPLRLNGVIGLGRPLVPDSWRLQLAGVENAGKHPQFADDVTAWQYRYAEAPAGPQAEDHDLKSAPESATKSTPEPPIAGRFDEMARELSRKRNLGKAEAGPSSSSLDIGTPGLLLTMDDLLKLPRHELVTEFKCIEGWSQIVHWGGVRLVDLIEAYPPAPINGHEPRFVYMETPDGDYYGGYDMAACRHPQSLLVTEIAGQPLSPEQGAPLRLHMPIKYGYKQLKRVGLIAYTDARPDDFWTKLGYDWYAGL
jgi:hypothetical protein